MEQKKMRARKQIFIFSEGKSTRLTTKKEPPNKKRKKHSNNDRS